MLLLTFGSWLTFFFVVVGNAQEAVRRVPISRNRSRRVNACGVGVPRARRIETGEVAVARAQEAVLHKARVSVAPLNRPLRVDAVRSGEGRARNIEHS